MNIIEKLQWRYATKKFDSNLYINKEKLNTIKEAFNLTATSYGLQPIKLVIVKDKKLQSRLVEHSMNQEQIKQASHILVFCIETKIDNNYIETYFKRVQIIRNTADEILQPFKNFLISYFKNMSQLAIRSWAINQAYLAMGNLLTICAIEDIDACPMEGFSPEKYNELLQLEKRGLSSVLVMPIGYRAKDDIFAEFKKVRKNENESVYEL